MDFHNIASKARVLRMSRGVSGLVGVLEDLALLANKLSSRSGMFLSRPSYCRRRGQRDELRSWLSVFVCNWVVTECGRSCKQAK